MFKATQYNFSWGNLTIIDPKSLPSKESNPLILVNIVKIGRNFLNTLARNLEYFTIITPHMEILQKIKSIPWKLVGLFFVKLFLYLIVIPIAATFIFESSFQLAKSILFKEIGFGGPNGIALRIWATMAFFIYSLVFYLYVCVNKYIRSKSARKWLLFAFIFFPGITGGVGFKYYTLFAIVGNLIYSGSYYVLYYLAEYLLPSYRGQLRQINSNKS